MSLTEIDWDRVRIIRAQIDGQAQVVKDCKRMMGVAQTNMAEADKKLRAYNENLHNALFPEGMP